MKKLIWYQLISIFGLIILASLKFGISLSFAEQLVNIGVKGESISTLAMNPSDNRTLYAGTQDGLFKSSDGGETWVPINEGLTSKKILTQSST